MANYGKLFKSVTKKYQIDFKSFYCIFMCDKGLSKLR